MVILYLGCTQNLEKLLIYQYKESIKTRPRCGSKKFWSLSIGQIRCSRYGLTGKDSKDLWKIDEYILNWKEILIEYFCFGIPACCLKFQVPCNQLITRDALEYLEKLFIMIRLNI